MKNYKIKGHGAIAMYQNIGKLVFTIVTGLLSFSTGFSTRAYDMLFDRVMTPMPNKTVAVKMFYTIKYNMLSNLLNTILHVLTLKNRNAENFAWTDNDKRTYVTRKKDKDADYVELEGIGWTEYRYAVLWAGTMERTLKPVIDIIRKDLKALENKDMFPYFATHVILGDSTGKTFNDKKLLQIFPYFSTYDIVLDADGHQKTISSYAYATRLSIGENGRTVDICLYEPEYTRYPDIQTITMNDMKHIDKIRRIQLYASDNAGLYVKAVYFTPMDNPFIKIPVKSSALRDTTIQNKIA